MKIFKDPRIRVAMIMAAILITALFIDIKNAGSLTDKIKRNSFGNGTKSETFRVGVEGSEEQTVDVKVPERKYTNEELDVLSRQALRKLDARVKGKNKSLDHVEHDLDLPASLPGFPFHIIWELDRYDVINMDGKLNQEALKASEESDNGALVTATAILKYQGQEIFYSITARLFPSKEAGGIKEQILEAVEQEDEKTATEDYLVLPRKAAGKRLYWKKERQAIFPSLLILCFIAAACLVLLKRQKEEQQQRTRKEQMLIDYPEIISQFTMLMGAGMTAKNAWQKVTDDYLLRKQQTGRERYAYEEMVCTWKEMQGKIPEAESYERFARRCSLAPYMKFGALLSQNLKKGAGGLAAILNIETVQALEDRKSRAKRLGEEAGTKLLLPMFLMLVIVMAIIIIPAFWSIHV